MRSSGVSVRACIIWPPTRSPAKRKADRTTPRGLARPRRATVIASKPNEPAIPVVSAYSAPSTLTAPPSPAKAPHTTMTDVITKGTDMPAVLAAVELAPTALN